jgi:hypothetical protein
MKQTVTPAGQALMRTYQEIKNFNSVLASNTASEQAKELKETTEHLAEKIKLIGELFKINMDAPMPVSESLMKKREKAELLVGQCSQVATLASNADKIVLSLLPKVIPGDIVHVATKLTAIAAPQ